tara:strand:+ start:8540 stop:9388 length:849 start_codon:yes stop_codon:yes gene_type:complete
MTAYSSIILNLKSHKVIIEIKCLNSKNLDLSCKIPSELKERDNSIRTLISKNLQRGKIDFILYYEKASNYNPTKINSAIVRDNINELKKIADGNTAADLLKIAIQMPNAYNVIKDSPAIKEWNKIQKNIKKAITQADKYRVNEGLEIQKDITNKIQNIKKLLIKVDKLKHRRIIKIKKKIKEDIVNLNLKIDNNRFEQELIYYLEKYDINEEIVRLNSHINFFTSVIKTKSPNGKKLGFISQEIGREINTIGAKSYDAGMQKIVVEMKDELEKIKEQILNIL